MFQERHPLVGRELSVARAPPSRSARSTTARASTCGSRPPISVRRPPPGAPTCLRPSVKLAPRRRVRLAACIGPDEWFLIAPLADQDAIETAFADLYATTIHSLVDVGHREVGIAIEGPEAAAALQSCIAAEVALMPVGSARGRSSTACRSSSSARRRTASGSRSGTRSPITSGTFWPASAASSNSGSDTAGGRARLRSDRLPTLTTAGAPEGAPIGFPRSVSGLRVPQCFRRLQDRDRPLLFAYDGADDGGRRLPRPSAWLPSARTAASVRSACTALSPSRARVTRPIEPWRSASRLAAANIDMTRAESELAALCEERVLRHSGLPPLAFDRLRRHLRFRAAAARSRQRFDLRGYDRDGREILSETYYSIGGGFVVTAAERDQPKAVDSHGDIAWPYPFRNAAACCGWRARAG